MEIPFTFDDKGHTVSDEVEVEEKPLSKFNSSLKDALTFNPIEVEIDEEE